MKRKHNNVNMAPAIESAILKSMSLTDKRSATDPKALEAYLLDNHTKYLNENLMIGFMDKFPEDPNKVIDEMIINDKCRGFDVRFKVRFGRVTFGPDDKMSCEGITTTRVSIGHNLPLGGYASFSHVDEADVMEKAVIAMAKKHGLMVCQKICSWPHAKAVVQKPGEAHIRCFKQEKQPS